MIYDIRVSHKRVERKVKFSVQLFSIILDIMPFLFYVTKIQFN